MQNEYQMCAYAKIVTRISNERERLLQVIVFNRRTDKPPQMCALSSYCQHRPRREPFE